MKIMFKKIVMTLALVAVLGFTGCSKTNTNAGQNSQTEANENVDYAAQLDEIHTAVKNAYGENYLANMPFDAETLENVYGISEDMYDVIVAEGPMMSVHVDNFIAVHPTEGKKQAVVDALTAYRDDQINNSLQYPMNLMKLEASQVKEVGDYVFYVCLGSTNEMFEDEAAELKAYQELNQVAFDAIDGVLNK